MIASRTSIIAVVGSMRLAPRSQLGVYEVLSLIGAGGMGEVYAARDGRLGRLVALKVLPERFSSHPDRLARFEREARVLAALSHPHIAAIHGVYDGDGVSALVLEMVDGPTLADRLTAGPIPVDQALAVAAQIAGALEAAHQHGFIHRDLKPSNIKLRADGTIKLLDFGLAKALDPMLAGGDLNDATVSGVSGVAIGTPAYMAPEQARGLAIDKRVDIWAFGCVLYEMLTGKQPFVSGGASEHTVSSLEPDWSMLPKVVPPAVRMLLAGCLRADPTLRIRDIGDVRLALSGHLDLAASASDRRERPSITATFRGAIILATAILLAFAGVMTWQNVAADRRTRPITFVLDAPDGSRFDRTTGAPAPAVSPDGLRLAFIAPYEARPVIWIQTVGAMDARPLPGSEDASLPFWSPDGQFVGFNSRGRLKKLAVTGDRAPQDLCACAAMYGAAWSADDTIIIAGATGLVRVRAGRDESTQLTQLDAARNESSHQSPFLLPDGRRFIYLVRSAQDDQRGLYLSSLDDPTLKRRVLPDDSNAAFAVDAENDGYLFFVRNRTLLAQRFDPSRGEVAGDATVVMRPLVPGEGHRFAAFSAAAGTVVYRRWIAPHNRLVWVDRRGTPQGTIGPERVDYDYIALSPDGRHAAVALRDWISGKRDIWLVDTERPVADQFTLNSPEAGFPVWAPDGDSIVYASTQTGTWDLHRRRLKGTTAEDYLLARKASLSGPNYPRDITPDGRFVLFRGGNDLWILALDEERSLHRLLAGIDGRVSPNGRWLAYTSLEAGQRQVYVTTFPTPGERWRVSIGGGQDPQWRRDGKELYYVAEDHTLTAVPVTAQDTFQAGTPDLLFRPAFDPQSVTFGSVYASAPDGQRFLIIEHMRKDDPVLVVTTHWLGPQHRSGRAQQ
jgi:serine/threonine protein kinase/Tol biopolymer transport system component